MSISSSPFALIEGAPADPILGLTEAFLADPNPSKVNLGVGVYQDASGKVPILNVVKEAEERLARTEASKSYLPIEGAPAYNLAVQSLLFGEDARAIAERAVTVQAPGGTGALRVGADFLKRFFPSAHVWISDPSWENHRGIFEAAGFPVEAYHYYNRKTRSLNFGDMLDDLRMIPEGNIVVLHVCCHNPSGVDLTHEQWDKVVGLFESRPLIPFLDFAYQGFGQGLEEDAYAVRSFARAGVPCLIASSFSKSFSLYRERVGALSLLTRDQAESSRVRSQVKRVIRTNYSSPPSHGGQVVAAVLGDPALRQRWEEELSEMRNRIQEMRSLFVRTLKESGARQDFGFIERQQGMFSFSGLSQERVRKLRAENGIYIVDSGRICLAALNKTNMPVVCGAIARVLHETPAHSSS